MRQKMWLFCLLSDMTGRSGHVRPSDVFESFLSKHSRVRVVSPSIQSWVRIKVMTRRTRIRDKSQELWSHFELLVYSSSQCEVTRNFMFFLRYSFAMKSCPIFYEMVLDKLENGVQCYFIKFVCRLFISKFSQFAFYLSLSLSIISRI